MAHVDTQIEVGGGFLPAAGVLLFLLVTITLARRGQYEDRYELSGFCSTGTRQTSLGKLDLASRAEAIAWLWRQGLLSDNTLSGGKPPGENGGFPG